MANRYSIDSSSLIEIKQQVPSDIFVSVWQKLGELAASGRLIAPDEVLREIDRDPDLGPWAKRHRRMFRRLDEPTLRFAKQIMDQFPGLVDREKETPDADPFVVALALSESRTPPGSLEFEAPEKCLVVTEERRRAVNIRTVCAHYAVPCMDHFGLFRSEDWKF